jgi:hypothetical protein
MLSYEVDDVAMAEAAAESAYDFPDDEDHYEPPDDYEP